MPNQRRFSYRRTLLIACLGCGVGGMLLATVFAHMPPCHGTTARIQRHGCPHLARARAAHPCPALRPAQP